MTHPEIEIDDESRAWFMAAYAMGESDCLDRLIATLAKIEAGERALLRKSNTVTTARSHRDRADAMKGAINIIRALTPLSQGG